MKINRTILTIGAGTVLASGFALSASAQQSTGTVRNDVIRDAVKQTIRPTVINPAKGDVGAQVRASANTLNRQQRLALARSMAERRVTGISAPTHLELEKGQLEVPLKVKGIINGPVRWRSGRSLFLNTVSAQTGSLTERGTIETRVVSNGALGLELIRPRTNPPRYYLIEAHYEGASASNANLLYVRDGQIKQEEAQLEYSDSGVISFLVDAEKRGSINNNRSYRLNYNSSNPLVQITIPNRGLSIKTVSVSPVR